MSVTEFQHSGDVIVTDSPVPKYRQFGGLWDKDGRGKQAVTIDTVVNHFGDVWIEANGIPIDRL